MKLIFAIFALALGACASAPPTTALPQLTFEQMQPISLNVARVEIIDAYRVPVSQDHVEHLLPVSPAETARKLVEKTLVPAGAGNVLRVIIDDASARVQKLPVRDDFWGNFTREPSEKYHAHVALRFELADERAPDIVLGHASVIADRTKTVLEHVSPADRDRAYFALAEDLAGDIYNGLSTTVRDTFGR